MIHRNSYTRKNGVHVKRACVKDMGKPGKGEPLIGKLQEGELSGVGYSFHSSKLSRHRALNKATRKYGALSVYRKLNAIAVLTKNTSRKTAKRAKSDRNWIGKHHGYKST
jgi:hypothetical protein